ncbi:MAG: SRPBCC domain-containing protein [Solirubrobacterales bacterium]|nr:SRPBCC domain-containing protein [Solirubrobacterales bacterium]
MLFDLDIQAPAEEIVAALDTAEGLRSWWTDDLEFPGGVGSTMKPNFPIAPMPFELTVEKVEPTDIAWRSVGEFPPPWKDTTIKWTLTANDAGGTRVHFDHDDWATDEGMFAMTAYTWGQLLGVLKNYLEAGVSQPMFVKAPASASTTDSPNQRQPPA